jgi:hypothetical protein
VLSGFLKRCILSGASRAVSVPLPKSLIPPARLGLPGRSPAAGKPSRAGRGSVVSRKMAYRLARGENIFSTVQGHQRALGRGSLVAAPFGAGMDAKSRDLALLAALSLSCAIFAWAEIPRLIIGSTSGASRPLKSPRFLQTYSKVLFIPPAVIGTKIQTNPLPP